MGVTGTIKTALLRHPALLAAAVRARYPRHRVFYDGDRFRVRRGRDEVWIRPGHAAYLPDLCANFSLMTEAVRPAEAGGWRLWDFTRPDAVLADGTPWCFPGLPETDATSAHYIAALGVTEGDVVWDVGAYSGLSTRALSRAVGRTGRVVAIEADPACWACLVQNVSGLSNVDLVNAALWHQRGQVPFQAEGNQGSTIAEAGSRADRVVHVDAVTPAEVLAATAAARVDVVKMDIEGAEYQVLPAFAEVLSTGARPRFLIEAHRARSGRVDARQLAGFLEDHGYRVLITDQPERGPFPLLVAFPA